MNLLKEEIQCIKGHLAKPKTFNVQGFEVRGWQCNKCGEIEYSDDIQKYLIWNKLRKNPLRVKVGVLGSSAIIRLPKEFLRLFNLKKGRFVELVPESMNKISLTVNEKRF